MTWRIADGALSLESPLLMGVVNVTPDSFSDGGRFAGEEAVAHGIALLEAGADIIDVGGESTRPGAHSVSESEELDRISDVVTGLVAAGAVVSIDTMKPVVAAHAIESGARHRERCRRTGGSGNAPARCRHRGRCCDHAHAG